MLGGVDQAVAVVANLGLFLDALVFLGMGLGVLDHAIDFVVGQSRGAGDGDLLLLAGAQVLGGDVHNAVGIDVERDLDLRHATARGRNAGELEATKCLVVTCHRALALQDMNLDGRLVVSCGRVNLGLAGRDGRVAVDHLRHDAAERLNTKRQRGDIEQQDALNITSENAALNGCTHGNNLVGVDRHVRLLARDGLDELLHGRHTGGATNQDDLVDLAGRVASVLQRLLDRLAATIEQVTGDALELSTCQRVVEVLRAGSVCRDERQVDVGLRDGRQLDLGLLGSFLQALQSHLVGAQVDAVLGLEFVG